MSEKRRREVAALVGGEDQGSGGSVKISGLWPSVITI